MKYWNSVDDVVPSDYEAVVAIDMTQNGVQIICTYESGKFVQDTTVAEVYGGDPLGSLDDFTVTHWMKLPEEPK